MSDYTHPEMLVSADWVEANLDSSTFKLVEIDVDTTAYDSGHIADAIGFNWQSQLMDQVNRDIIGQEDFETLMGESGIAPDDLVIVYGDNNNWFAAYGLWIMKYYGHANVKLMNGGRVKWVKDGKSFTTDPPAVRPTGYSVSQKHPELRAMLPEILEVAFGWCPESGDHRRLVSGVNWSAAIINPFRRLGETGRSLDTMLERLKCGNDEEVVIVMHIATPCAEFTDRGKSSLVMEDG